MAVTRESVDLIEQIFEQTNLALDESYTERIRNLGDSSCKAGIEATIRYLSEKTEISDSELEMLSAGNIPFEIRKRDFEAHFEQLNKTTDPKPSEADKRFCEDAFDSGLSSAIYYLLKVSRSRDVDLLSIVS